MGGLVDLISWMQSRVFVLPILLLYISLVIGLWLSLSPVDVAKFSVACAFCASFLVTFRLWDDLVDRKIDQTNSLSRDRVLVTTKHASFLIALLCAALITVAFAIMKTFGLHSLLFYFLHCSMMALIYYLPILNQGSRIQREILVLLKYPLFLLLLSPVVNLKTIILSLVLYTVLLVHYFYECRQND